MNIEFDLSTKQVNAYEQLLDEEVSELVFGGGARGGKTYLGSFWVISACYAMPGSAWLIARQDLKTLKRTTQRTFFKVLSTMGLKRDVDYKYNAQDQVIEFIKKKSVVFFAELRRLPGDPEFDRIGSFDLTGAWIDEAQEICKDAKDALQFRFTVLEGEGWVTVPTTLYTCNPGKNWIYSEFWKPLVRNKGKQGERTFAMGKRFITSLYTDNPWIDHQKYKKNVLKTGNKAKIQRLLYGNFDYDDDPNCLFSFNVINDLFTNHAVASKTKYCTVDVGRKGKDPSVFRLWEGLKSYKTIRVERASVPGNIAWCKKIERDEGIRRSHFVIDEGGVGGGVVDGFKGCTPYLGGSKPIIPRGKKVAPNYLNLKAQCAFELARIAKQGRIEIVPATEKEKERIKEELAIVKERDADKDDKIKITKKEDMNELLGRSPDDLDTLLMRMLFEIKKPASLEAIFV